MMDRGVLNWFGLRCALRLCPFLPTRRGAQCLFCARELCSDSEE